MNENKNKKKDQLLVFIIGGIVLAALTAGILLSDDNSSNKKDIAALPDYVNEQKDVMQTDILLHSKFDRLQKLDEEYNLLVFNDSGAFPVERMNSMILNAETDMQKTIDSIKENIPDYNSWENVTLLDSITTAFTMALSNRRYIAEIRNMVAAKHISMDPAQKQLIQLQQKIVRLEKDLKAKSPVAAAPFGEIEELKSSLHEEETRTAGLVEMADNLNKQNQQIASAMKQAAGQYNTELTSLKASKTRVQKLQEEINELSAELNFARIDCNLSRADANKIISNSKQRKELLGAALKSLQSLSTSENDNIQRRAREKLTELNHIASTVRD